MPQDDPFAQYAVKPVSAPPPVPTSGGSDPFAKYAVTPEAPSPSQPSQAAPSSDPFAKYAVGGGGASSPENGQGEQDTTIGQRFSQAWGDPSKGFLGHVWSALNTPVIDFDSALGRTGQAGGFEKGANDLASGLTSPLSIALTIGTLGLGGLVEAGGASALRAAGMGASELADVTKGAQIVKDATSAGRTFQQGLEAAKAAGVDPATLTKGLQALKAASLDSSSLLSKGIVRNSATALASKLGLSAKTADTVGQGLQFLTTAGFTAQQATQAAELSPRVLDALKDAAEETDPVKKQEAYALAERLAVNAVGSAVLGGLGAHETLKESGGLMDDLAAKAGLKVKPSAENLILRNEAGRYAAEVAEAGRTQELWEHGLRKAYPKMDPVQLERVRYLVESGGDEDVMAQRGRALSEAAGRDESLPSPENGQMSDEEKAQRQLRHASGETYDEQDWNDSKNPIYKHTVDGITYQSKEVGQVIKVRAVDQNGTRLAQTNIVPSRDGNYEYRPLDTSEPVTGQFYHGTKAPISSVSELDPSSHGNEQSLYGIGAYLTDNPEVAKGYAKSRGKGPEGKVLPATINNARLLDIEQPPPANVRSIFENAINGVTGGKEPLDPSLTGKDLFKKLQTAMEDESYPRSEAQDVLGELTTNLRQGGFDGLRHEGGDKVGGHGKHNVAVVFPDYGVGRPLGDIVKDAPSLVHGKQAFATGMGVPENLRGNGYAKDLYKQLPTIAKKYGIDKIVGEGIQTPGGAAVWQSLAKEGTAEPTEAFGQTRLGMTTDNAPDVHGLTTSGMTPERLREVIDQKNLAAKYKPAEIDRLLDAYDPSKLTDADRALAKEIRNKFSKTLEFAHQKDALADGQGIKDYVTSMYEKGDEDNPATNQLVHDAGSGSFQTQTSMARQRLFDNAFEAQLFGKKLSETDPIKLAAHNANVFQRVVAAREMKERLLDAGTRASDGMPLLAHSGDASPVTDEQGNAVMVNPRGVRSIKIADNVVQGLRDSGDLDRLVKSGKIRNLTRTITPDNLPQAIDRLENSMIAKNPQFDAEGNSVMLKNIQLLKDVRDGKLPKSALDDFNAQRPDVYAWNPAAANYQVIDHPSMRDWKYLTTSPSGDSVVMKSDIMAHPEAAEYLKRILGVDKDAGTGVISKVASKINQEAKGVLLFGSPFHVLQIGLRGIMSGISPIRRLDRWDIANDPKLSLGVQQSLTLGKNYHNMAAFSEGGVAGHSAIIGKIPGLNRIQTSLNSFLFDKYIPTMKVEAYKSLYNRYEEAHPDWTAPRIAREAAEDTNEKFGGLNYRDLGRAASTQNWFKLLALAPDWFESEARSILRPFHPDGNVSRTDMARIAAYMWTGSRVLNMLINNGHPHMEAPFGVVYKQDNGKSNVISMRSLPSDLLHAVSDPLGFIRGRMSPLVRTGDEIYSGRDSYGRKLNHGDLVMDVLHNQLPIPGQAIGKTITGMTPEVGNVGQLLNAGGFTDTIYRTEAQKLAAQLASDRSESGPVNQEQLARHNQLMQMENQLRAGQLTHQQIQDLYIDGHITQAEKSKIDKNFTQTKGLPADQAQLLIRASRLDAPSLLRLWDVSTPSEKVVLAKTMSTAKTRYINRAVKDMTPAQRQDDPTIKRLRTMFVTPQIQ